MKMKIEVGVSTIEVGTPVIEVAAPATALCFSWWIFNCGLGSPKVPSALVIRMSFSSWQTSQMAVFCLTGCRECPDLWQITLFFSLGGAISDFTWKFLLVWLSLPIKHWRKKRRDFLGVRLRRRWRDQWNTRSVTRNWRNHVVCLLLFSSNYLSLPFLSMHMVVFCFATSHPASHTIALILVLKFGLSLCRVLRSFLNFRLLILFYLKKRNTRMKLFLNGDSNKRTLLDLNQALNYLSRVAHRPASTARDLSRC